MNACGEDLADSLRVGLEGSGLRAIDLGCLGPPTLGLLSLCKSSIPVVVLLRRGSSVIGSFGRVS